MQTSNNTSITTGIHCKVNCNNQYRRFFFTGTDYQSLYKQVQSLLALENEFVLKYKDDESDLISISSDEELSFAVNFIGKGGILRLTVALQLPVPMASSPKEGQFYPHPRFDFHGGPWHHRQQQQFGGGRGRFHHHPCRYGKHETRGHEDKRSWLIHKKDALNERLQSFSSLGELSPHQQHCQTMIMFKIQRIEARLANVQGDPKFDHKCKKKFEKREKKFNKKEKKCEKKMKHHPYVPHGETVQTPSDDMTLDQPAISQPAISQPAISQQPTETQSDTELVKQLKEQLRIHKPVLIEAKTQLRERKAALGAAKRTGASPQEIAKLQQEVAQLKEAKKAKYTEVQPLRQRIYNLEEVRRVKK